MKGIATLGLVVALAVGLAAPAAAQSMTLKGSVVCAKCTLKKADASQCQDVLLVKNDKGESDEYYITKNDVADTFGHTCSGETAATVTGTVAEKDGKMWVTPSKMEKAG